MKFFYYIKNHLVSQIIISFLQGVKLRSLGNTSLYDFLRIYALRILHAEVTTRASASAYSLFMSFFPFSVFFFSLVSKTPYNKDINEYIYRWVMEILPPQTEQIAWETIMEITSGLHFNLLSWSFVFLLFFSTNGIYSLIASFENGIPLTKQRKFLKRYGVAFLMTIFFSLLLLFSLLFIYYSQVVWRFFTDIFTSSFLLNLISYFSLWVAFFIGIYILYYFGSHLHFSWKQVVPGAIFTTFFFALFSFLFGIYIRNFSNYNLLYGSIGTILILMLWLYINNLWILLGHEINATIWQLKNEQKVLTNYPL